MATQADKIVVEIEARFARAQAQTEQFRARFENAMGSINDQLYGTQGRFNTFSNKVSADLGHIVSAFRGLQAVKGLADLADANIRFANNLKIAGVASQDMARVQETLYAMANKNGMAVTDLSDMYRTMAVSSGELGVNQTALLGVMEGVAAAIAMQGGASAASDAALVRLSQAMASGTVGAMEFNSIMTGLPALMNVAAQNIEGTGGSVAQLRAMMLDGAISSKQFFEAIRAGGPALQAMAAEMDTTLGGAMAALWNNLQREVGALDETTGASERLVAVIRGVANNMDMLAPSIVMVGAVLLARMAPGIIAAAKSALVLDGVILRARASLTGFMGLMGGPVGMAIIGVAGAFMYASHAAELAVPGTDKYAGALDRLRGNAEKAGIAVRKTGEEIDAANKKNMDLSVRDASADLASLQRDFSGNIKKITATSLADSGEGRYNRGAVFASFGTCQ